MTDNSFDLPYPDVLGAIAGNMRVTLGNLQVAVGVFPRSAYVNQPIEVVVLLQNLIDQPVEVRVALHTPKKDNAGRPVMISVARREHHMTLAGGEVGALRMPILPLAPTAPQENLPLLVSIRQRSAGGKTVRLPSKGAPPSALLVSPFKLQALRDVDFFDHRHDESPDALYVYFTLLAKQMPVINQPLEPTYETLWTVAHMPAERAHMLERLDDARIIAASFTPGVTFPAVMRCIDDLYALRGLPLHPGEARAIAKLIAYTLDYRLHGANAIPLEEMRWLQTLAQVLASDSKAVNLKPEELVTRHLLEAAVYDAVLIGFAVIRPLVGVNLGDRAERAHYANRVIRWLTGLDAPDLSYIYLPLVLGGVAINHLVAIPKRDAESWTLLEQLREAYRGRVRLAHGEELEIFDMLDALLERGADELTRAQIDMW